LVASKAASQVDEYVSIRFVGAPAKFVSRGGLKLEAALDSFAIEVVDRQALDVGASTGGFTDCLLQRGAAGVVAVDVGYGQLDWQIRNDPRVEVHERFNARHMAGAALGGPFDVVVADLSFISLRTVAPALTAVGGPEADWVLLVKPQFEAGRGQVGKGGIVRDVAVRARTLRNVIEAFEGQGLGARGVTDSPITGAKGNREFLLWLRREPTIVADADFDRLAGMTDA
jgi:23S rRNA (cytidine1920-2'-O)/16S rRNA (cytidine1409-2'-O)-methyltransferase